MTTQSIWSRLTETVACQVRNGWALVLISVGLTLAIVRIGLAASVFLALVLTGVVLARNCRVTVRRKSTD